MSEAWIREGHARRRWAPVWKLGLYAAAFSTVINAMLYVVTLVAAGSPHAAARLPGVPHAVQSIALLSAAGALCGALVFALLRRCVGNPVVAFRVGAAAVLVVALAARISLPFAPVAVGMTVQAMHVVVVAVTVGVFTRELV